MNEVVPSQVEMKMRAQRWSTNVECDAAKGGAEWSTQMQANGTSRMRSAAWGRGRAEVLRLGSWDHIKARQGSGCLRLQFTRHFTRGRKTGTTPQWRFPRGVTRLFCLC